MDALRELADAHGVATAYWDWRGEHVSVPGPTLDAVLTALGVDTADPEAALRAAADEPWQHALPPYLVVREGTSGHLPVHVADGADAEVWITREDGEYHGRLSTGQQQAAPREVGGRWVSRLEFTVPGDLPPGYHTVHLTTRGEQHRTMLIVPPAWLGMPAHAGEKPLWGLATQLYSVRAHHSWGIGDLSVLADLATWAAAEHGAGFVLVNPLHAAEPVAPVQASPYLPTSRRFANPIYLRLDRIAEYAELDAGERAEVDRLEAGVDVTAELIDRDAVWTAKRAALEIIHRHGREPGRELAYQAFVRREADALRDFATWCVLAETHGPDWHDWPQPLQHPRSEQVTQFSAEHAAQLDFHQWLQWILDEQLAAAQDSARTAGMALGIVHDLAVGVSRTGADSWSWQDEFARGMSVGAPPDAYAQTGQNWNQPPWRPDRLAALGYAPLRELIANSLRHSGGLRVDHIIGLFRLWWIPDGATATEGTYVRYDHDASIGILALEAARARAVVIGEDLGTVEPWVRDYLAARGVLGTSVLWFERDWAGDGQPVPPQRWREYCLASVTTHDLPPTAGYLAGDHVRLREQLGLLTRPMDEELAADRADQTTWLDLLRQEGLVGAHADVPATVRALHLALSRAPSRLRCLALTDAVGDRRTQNQPGANEGYPNWQVPLTDPDGLPVTLEDVLGSTRAAELADVMRVVQ